MSLKSQIETAKDAVSKALITALENKNESAVSNLITCYNTLCDTKVTDSIKFDLGNYEMYNIPCSTTIDDVITFNGLS
jgi:hypothetical protein